MLVSQQLNGLYFASLYRNCIQFLPAETLAPQLEYRSFIKDAVQRTQKCRVLIKVLTPESRIFVAGENYVKIAVLVVATVDQLKEQPRIQAGSDTVLRFYLRQTVSEDGGAEVRCSPADLITESDCGPVRKKVLAVSAPSRTVTVPMEELADYISRLPRLLTEKLTIKVSGEWTGMIPIVGFYGCGTLSIQGEGTAILHGGIQVCNCGCMVWLEKLTMKATAEMAAEGGYLLYCASAAAVWTTDCTIVGLRNLTGVRATDSSLVSLISSSVTGCTYALETTTSSIAALAHTSGAGYADNVTGVYAYNGGIAIFGPQIPDLLGGTSNRKKGGAIVREDGTLL